MIPTIEDILMYFKNGDCTLKKAISWIEQHHENADLRDHFAGLAMHRMFEVCTTYANASNEAYEYADAMLKARAALTPKEQQ